MYICVWKMENIFEKVKTKLENVNPWPKVLQTLISVGGKGLERKQLGP